MQFGLDGRHVFLSFGHAAYLFCLGENHALQLVRNFSVPSDIEGCGFKVLDATVLMCFKSTVITGVDGQSRRRKRLSEVHACRIALQPSRCGDAAENGPAFRHVMDEENQVVERATAQQVLQLHPFPGRPVGADVSGLVRLLPAVKLVHQHIQGDVACRIPSVGKYAGFQPRFAQCEYGTRTDRLSSATIILVTLVLRYPVKDGLSGIRQASLPGPVNTRLFVLGEQLVARTVVARMVFRKPLPQNALRSFELSTTFSHCVLPSNESSFLICS
jgi:hypothetical protein